MSTSQDHWWRFILSCEDSDQAGYLASELGASGIHIIDASTLHAFFHIADNEVEQTRDMLVFNELQVHDYQQLTDQNWSRQCTELWEPCQFRSFQIIPVASSEDIKQMAHPLDPQPCFLTPSTGFGTGHHPTTHTLLQFLEHADIESNPPRRVLDLGCGSGILGITCAKLYDSTVTCVEPDPDAVTNARHNIDLNALDGNIDLVEGDIRSVNAEFDLIFANIYAEILTELADEIFALLGSNGSLLLSGIVPSSIGDVKSAYLSRGFTFRRELSIDNWYSGWLKK